MDKSILLIVLICLALAAILVVFWLLRRRGGKQAPGWLRDDQAEAAPPSEESAATAVELSIDRGPLIPPAPEGPPDDLTRMKGVGPKVATLLAEMGVTHYSQIAAWGDDEITAVDARLGAFTGRITRDRWVEQAGYLARGDIAGFEAQFGKLGG
jgi:predicted flap endonuclease-1-like 5' DNA nuclease